MVLVTNIDLSGLRKFGGSHARGRMGTVRWQSLQDYEFLQGPRLKEFVHLPSQYAASSFRTQCVASSWAIPIV